MPKLIVDANILLVFIVGYVDPKLLGDTKGVKDYSPSDFDIIIAYFSLFTQIVLLPNIVTEASNLLDHLKGRRRRDCMERLGALLSGDNEIYVASRVAAIQGEYVDLGITDAAILSALDSDTYLLTSDRKLFEAAVSRLGQAEYFDDLR